MAVAYSSLCPRVCRGGRIGRHLDAAAAQQQLTDFSGHARWEPASCAKF